MTSWIPFALLAAATVIISIAWEHNNRTWSKHREYVHIRPGLPIRWFLNAFAAYTAVMALIILGDELHVADLLSDNSPVPSQGISAGSLVLAAGLLGGTLMAVVAKRMAHGSAIEAGIVIVGRMIPWASIDRLEVTERGVRLHMPKERTKRQLLVVERPFFDITPEVSARLQSTWQERRSLPIPPVPPSTGQPASARSQNAARWPDS